MSDVKRIAEDLRNCAESWEPGARLLGNVTAAQIGELLAHLRTTERLLDAVTRERDEARENANTWHTRAAVHKQAAEFAEQRIAELTAELDEWEEATREAARGFTAAQQRIAELTAELDKSRRHHSTVEDLAIDFARDSLRPMVLRHQPECSHPAWSQYRDDDGEWHCGGCELSARPEAITAAAHAAQAAAEQRGFDRCIAIVEHEAVEEEAAGPSPTAGMLRRIAATMRRQLAKPPEQQPRPAGHKWCGQLKYSHAGCCNPPTEQQLQRDQNLAEVMRADGGERQGEKA